MRKENLILIVDHDQASIAELTPLLAAHGLVVESAEECLTAVEKLRTRSYQAVVIDPMIRHRLNGYAVLDYIELHHPEMVPRVFLLTGMSAQTVVRTAPALAPRWFRKPADMKKAAAAVAASITHGGELASREPKGSVLVVEDDPETATVTCELLEELGFTCKWLTGGSRVLETVSASRFDAIMLDLVMPDVDGFTVLDQLRQWQPELLSRVVVTTGMPDRYLEELSSWNLGGIAQKPLDGQTLQRLLNRCTGGVAFEAGGELPEVG